MQKIKTFNRQTAQEIRTIQRTKSKALKRATMKRLAKAVFERRLSPFELSKIAPGLNLSGSDLVEFQSLVTRAKSIRHADDKARKRIRLFFRKGLENSRGRIAARYIPNLVVGGTRHGIFFLPDYPKIIQEEVFALNEKTVRSIFIDSKKERFVQLMHSFGRTYARKLLPEGPLIDYVAERVKTDPNYVSGLMNRERLWRSRLEKALAKAEQQLQAGKISKINVRNLFNRLTDYSSLNLTRIFSHDFFLKNLAKIDGKVQVEGEKIPISRLSVVLLHPAEGTSSFIEFRAGLLRVVIQKMEGKLVDYRKFARETGFLGANLLVPKVETKRQIDAQINKIIDSFIGKSGSRAKAFLAMKRELKELEANKEGLAKVRQVALWDTHVASAKFRDRGVFDDLMEFPGVVTEFNEKNRILRSKTFRILRILMQKLGLGVNQTSIAELEAAIKKMSH